MDTFSMMTSLPADTLQTQAIRQGLAVGLDDTLSLISVTGPDAAQYLHSRTTQDLLTLEPGEGAYAALLDKGAHALSYFSVHRLDDNQFVLVLPKAAEKTTLAELTKYRITEHVEFYAKAGCVYRTCGPDSAAYLHQALGLNVSSLPTNGAIHIPMGEWADSVIIHQPLGDTDAWLWWMPFTRPLAVPKEAIALTLPMVRQLQLEAGLPQWGVDFNAQTLLPETGLEVVAVSYTKGCYLGQETMARVKTYGSVQKRLAGLLLPALTHLPAPGHPVVTANGITVGQFASVAWSAVCQATIAMAYLDKTHRTPGQVLTLDINGQQVDGTVTLLPFVGSKPDIMADSTPPEQTRDQALNQLLTRFAQIPAETGDPTVLDAIAADLSTLLAEHPGYADALEALGVLRSRQGRYAEAITLMEQLLDADPNRVMAHTNMSIYWLKLGDKEKAEDHKAKATILAMRLKMQQSTLTATEQDEAARKQQQQLQDKVNLFLNALKQYPDDPLGNYGLASTYMELNQPYEAIPYFEKALVGQPNHSVAYLSLGKCYEATQQWVHAKTTYDKGIAVAAKRGDQMPLADMQQRMARLKAI
jgi:folate-binding protein YgfZ